MARLPDILGSLGAEAKKVYDRIAAKRGRIGRASCRERVSTIV